MPIGLESRKEMTASRKEMTAIATFVFAVHRVLSGLGWTIRIADFRSRDMVVAPPARPVIPAKSRARKKHAV